MDQLLPCLPEFLPFQTQRSPQDWVYGAGPAALDSGSSTTRDDGVASIQRERKIWLDQVWAPEVGSSV